MSEDEEEMSEKEREILRNFFDRNPDIRYFTENSNHDYEPGEEYHPMHTNPLCAICGKPRKDH